MAKMSVEEIENMTIEEVDELYAASKLTAEDYAEIFHLPVGYCAMHDGEEDLDWVSEYDENDWIIAETGKFVWDEED